MKRHYVGPLLALLIVLCATLSAWKTKDTFPTERITIPSACRPRICVP